MAGAKDFLGDPIRVSDQVICMTAPPESPLFMRTLIVLKVGAELVQVDYDGSWIDDYNLLLVNGGTALTAMSLARKLVAERRITDSFQEFSHNVTKQLAIVPELAKDLENAIDAQCVDFGALICRKCGIPITEHRNLLACGCYHVFKNLALKNITTLYGRWIRKDVPDVERLFCDKCQEGIWYETFDIRCSCTRINQRHFELGLSRIPDNWSIQ